MSKIKKDVMNRAPLAIYTSLLLMVLLLVPFTVGAENTTNLGLNNVQGTLIGYNNSLADLYVGIKIKTPLVNDKFISITLNLKKYGNPTDDLVITLRGDNSDAPDQTIYGTATINGTDLTQNNQSYTFSFNNTNIATQTTYWIVLTRSLNTFNQTNYYELAVDTNYTNCNIKTSSNSSTWNAYVNKCAYGKFTTEKTSQSGGQTSNSLTDEIWTIINENSRTNAWYFSIIFAFTLFSFGYFVIRY